MNRVLKSGLTDECGCDPAEFLKAVAQQADEVVIAKQVPAITHWWLLRSSPTTKVAYFGTAESYADWQRKGVN